ncbi:MAG: translesion error-prone DNA polymerase V autoproteolytic subunit [Candidatus Margulisiibacteriota bacterium]
MRSNITNEIKEIEQRLNIELPEMALPFLINQSFSTQNELQEKIKQIHATFKNESNSETVESLQALFKKKISNIKLPLYGTSVSCGFTSPAEDHVENQLSLDEYLVSNPDSTFFVRSSGNSMTGAGIFDGDLLIIDRSIEAKNNHIVLAIVDTEFTVKRLCKRDDQIILRAENTEYNDICISDQQNLMIWGVVVHVIHHLK